MHRYHRSSSLAPSGLVVGGLTVGPDAIDMTAYPASKSSACPTCDQVSTSVHSRYERVLSDLPSHGRAVRIRVTAHRFRCYQPACRQRIFTERLDRIAAPSARRTTRLEGIVHHIGLALGGRPGQSLARRLVLPVSKDTLLRIVRRYAVRPDAPLHVVGIDDWAWKRGQRYGTIVCDLERRRIVDILPDRETSTVAAWLKNHPLIRTISRDRGGGYARASAQARPQAIQVADRWHLMENASAAFLEATRRSMRTIRAALGTATIDPTLLTCAEQLRYEGWRRREEANSAILALAKKGVSIKEIVRQTGHARGTVRRVVRGGRTDVFRTRSSGLERFWPRLDAEWRAGCRNGAELWRRLRSAGFPGSQRAVSEWVTRRRMDEVAMRPRRPPSARAIARMMTIDRDRVSKTEAFLVATIEAAAPALAAARDLMDRFHAMIRQRDVTALDSWIEEARPSLLKSLATGIAADYDAVRNALSETWSNGQTEGQITKLKLVKRQMYGRAKLDLLRARLLGAP
jgi:transposase